MKRPTIKEKVPNYLRPFVAEQDPSLYSAIDHAGWRYIMRVSKSFFGRHAHQKYLDGLRETGISTERIPLIEEMDQKLEQFGWRACAIVGFIPPAVFMEFLSLGILPIACDIRRHEHLAYTPAPDIVHEAAGHAPIIADQEYADYLYQYGEVARKVIFSSQDIDVYEAIRNLSDIKEDAASTQMQIEDAQKRLDQALARVDYVSEATLLSRMGWWTIEYGLVGDMSAPKIYGAGLLSSVGESYHCLGPEVKKIPFSLDCLKVSYDITKPQPQLFVTPDFQTLKVALEEFSNTLAFRRGGLEGLEIAKKSATVTTTVFDSGVQIGGIVDEILIKDGAPVYLRFKGPCELGVDDYELEGHGPAYHAQGFGTPVGPMKDGTKNLVEMSLEQLKSMNGHFEFASGVVVDGEFLGALNVQGRNLVLSFKNCTVKLGQRVLFEPSWGTFDLAVGTQVTSVFGGAPDRGKYLEATGGFTQKPANPKTNLTKDNAPLNELYLKVRAIRESRAVDFVTLEKLESELERIAPQDWLLRLEILELVWGSGGAIKSKIQDKLGQLAASSPEHRELIERGLKVLS